MTPPRRMVPWLVCLAPVVAVAFSIWSFGCSDDRPPISGGCTATADGIPCTAAPVGGGVGGSGSCGFSSPIVACNDCITATCCNAGTTCSLNSSCLALSQCVNGCVPDGSTTVDPNCAQACETLQDAGISDYVTFVTCVQSACPSCQ